MFVYSILIKNIRNQGYLATSMKSNYLEEAKFVACQNSFRKWPKAQGFQNKKAFNY